MYLCICLFTIMRGTQSFTDKFYCCVTPLLRIPVTNTVNKSECTKHVVYIELCIECSIMECCH